MQGCPVPRGNSGVAGQAALDDAHGMNDKETAGIFIGFHGGLVHQPADGEVGHEQAPELLLHQLARLAPERDLRAAQMRL